MRRLGMALLAFFGIACIAAAITIPTYLVPKLKVVPLDLDITSDSTSIAALNNTGERFPAVIFDRCSVSEDRAKLLTVSLKQQRRSVVVDPSDADQATIQAAQSVLVDRIREENGEEVHPTVAPADSERTCRDGLLTANIDRVSLDRKTSAPNGVISSLQMEADPEGVPVEDVSVRLDDRKGFQYKFGFDVQKQDYYYYDLNTRADAVAKFVEETTINGLKVYHFRADVPETDISNLPNPQGEAPLGTILTMPAEWWGITGQGVRPNTPVTMHRHAAAVRNVWVEPVTGTIVDGYEEQHQYFKSPEGTEDLPEAITGFQMDALKANFKLTDQTVSEQTDRAKEYVNLLKWGGTYVPIILGVLGALLLILWGWLTFRGRDDDGTGNDAPRGGAPTGDEAAEPVYTTPEAPTEVLGTDTSGSPAGRGPGATASAAAGGAALSADEYWAPETPTTTAERVDTEADTIVFEPIPDPEAPSAPRHGRTD